MSKRKCLNECERLAVKPKNTETAAVLEEGTSNVSLSNQVFSQEGIVANILSHLEISDIRRCSEVSKTCLKTMVILEELYIVAPPIIDSGTTDVCFYEILIGKLHLAEKMFGSENNLRRLSIDFDDCWLSMEEDECIRQRITQSLYRFFSSCKKLKHIHLKGLKYDIEEYDEEYFYDGYISDFEAVGQCAELETLVIENCFLPHLYTALYSMLQNKSNLRVLDLTDTASTTDVDDKDDKSLSIRIASLTNLQKLVIHNVDISLYKVESI